MTYKNLNLPTTVVREVNGKRYRIEGTLMSINESAGVCTVKFGNKISNNVPVSNVYLNEGFIDTLKKAGKAAWGAIKRVVRAIGGFLLPVDENGNKLTQFINAPINVLAMNLPSSIVTVASDEVADYADEHSIKVNKNVKYSLIDALEEAESNDAEEANKYWGRVMKEYIKKENANVSLSTTIKYVNEKYYHKVLNNKPLNEGVPSLHNLVGGYGREVGAKELTQLIYESLWGQLNPISDLDPDKKLDDAGTAKPLLIWGAPGIGKTAIISKAAKLLEDDGYHLGMHIIKCAALKRDDFELPDTVHNVVGQKLAVSNPKTWLPVYDPKGLTREQLIITDAIYNSGVYKMYDRGVSFDYTDSAVDDTIIDNADNQTGVAQKIAAEVRSGNISPKIQQLLDSTKQNGGILFFDEFARLQSNVTNIMMGLMGERMYGEDFILASQWSTIAAANRLSDDLTSEDNAEFRKIWDAAKQGRYEHYTYVPSKDEWLEWARKRNKHTGLQNVDEKFCMFIEESPDYVWYDALDLGSRDIEDEGVKSALAALGSVDDKGRGTTKVGELTMKQVQTIGEYLEGNSDVQRLKLGTWNPRTWDEIVNTRMIQALRQLVGKTSEDLLSVMSPVKHSYKEYGETIEYESLNLDDAKLKVALDEIPRRKWYLWAEPKVQRVDPTQKLINTDRIGFWNNWITNVLIPDAMGGDKMKPAVKWKEYTTSRSILSKNAINNIWDHGYDTEYSLIKFANPKKYHLLKTESWKYSDPATVKKIIDEVIDNYPGDLVSDLQADFQAVQNMDQGNFISEAESNRIKDMFNIKLINGDRSEISNNGQLEKTSYKRVFNCLIDPDVTSKEDALKITTLLSTCPATQKLANIMKWIAILAVEIPSEAGLDHLASTTDRVINLYMKTANNNVQEYWNYIAANIKSTSAPFNIFETINQTIQNYIGSNSAD